MNKNACVSQLNLIRPSNFLTHGLSANLAAMAIFLFAMTFAQTSLLRADYFFNSIDSPYSSIGAANSAVLGVNGSNVVGSFDISNDSFSYVYNGTNYTVLDDTNATIPGTVAVGASANGIVGNYAGVDLLNYGFFTTNGVDFITMDPSGAGLTTNSGISGTTIFGNYGTDGTAFFSSSTNPSVVSNIIIQGSLPNTVTVSGANGELLFGTYESASGTFGFTTSNGSDIVTVTAPQGSEIETLQGITLTGGIVGTYVDSNSITTGFITTDGSILTPILLSDSVAGSVQLLGVSGQNALGSYQISTSGNQAGFLTPDGVTITRLYGPNQAGWEVVGASGAYVFGNTFDSNGMPTGAFWTTTGSSYNPIPGPTNAIGLTVTNVFSGSIAGQYFDSQANAHNFVCLVSATNGLTPNYLTVDGPPTGSSITAMSLSNSLGFFVDQNGYNNCFLISGGTYYPVPSPNSDVATAATQLIGYSSTNAVGIYFDAEVDSTCGFLTANGTNYTRILGPANAGIQAINAISGTSIAGTYKDPNSNNTYGFLTQNGGSSYTILKGPAGADGGILSVNGVSGTTVVGTYKDTVDNLLGFQGSTKVTSPGQLDTVNGISGSSIVGTYTETNSGNEYTYGFIGTGNTSIRGPYGTNGVGITSVDVISGNLIAGTYVDTDTDPNADSGTSYRYGYLTTDGVNYVTVSGPPDSSGGVVSINYLSGSANTVIGTYLDTNSVMHWFAYDYDAANFTYTILDNPLAQPGGSMDGSAGTTVNGISDSTVFGTYLDNYGLTHGFQANLLQPQNITFNPTFTGSTPGVFLLNGNSTAGLPVSYSFRSGSDIASISNNILTITNAGTVTVVASQSGNNQYLEATSVTNTITILSQTIGSFSPISAQTYGVPFTVPSPSASPSGLPVRLSVSGPATIAGNLITPNGTGALTLIASQSGNSNYLAASPVSTTIGINKASQTIASFALISAKNYGAAPFAVTLPTASSALPVTLSVSSGSALISGNIVTVSGAGQVVLAANQGGNANYLAAPAITTTFTVNPASQTISSFASIPVQTYGQPFTVVPPTSSSGLPVVLTVSGPASISSNTVTPTGVGLVTIAANQSGNGNYTSAAQVTTTTTIKQAQQVLSAFTPVTSVVADYTTLSNGISITPPTSSNTNSTVIVTVASGPATISNNIVTMTGNGVVTLSASQAGNVNYLAATPVTTSFSVGKATQTLSGPIVGVSDKVFGSAPFTVTLPNASSMLPVILSVVSGPATVSGTTVTLTGVGSVTLAATQAGNTTTGPVQTIASFTVSQGSNAIAAFAPIANMSYGVQPFRVAAPVATSGLPVSLSVLSGPATLSGNTITITGAGTVTVAADQPGNANYTAAQGVTTTFTVNPASQTIGSFAPIPAKTYGVAPFTVAIPTASSGLPVTLTVRSGPASVSGNIVTITGVGPVILAADQAGSSNYSAATAQTVTFSVTGSTQTISSFAPIPAQTYGVPFNVTPPTASSGLGVELSVVAGPATISGNTVTPTGMGLVSIAANQAGNSYVSPAAQVLTTVTVNAAPQVLQPFQIVPNIAIYTPGSPFAITPPLSSSTNPVIVTVKSGPASIVNNIVTVTGNGVVVLTATQPAQGNYLAAAPVTTSFSVGKRTQSLSGSFAVLDANYPSAPITVTALPVSVDSSNNPTQLPVALTVLSGPATVSGSKVTVTGAGVVTLAANQAGNATYGPAAQMTTTFNVAQGSNTINAFGANVPSSVVYGASPLNVTVPTASSGLPVTLSVLSGPATLSGNTVTVTGVGPVTLAANQAGNANYPAAAQVTTTVNVTTGSQTIAPFAAIAAKTYGNAPFAVTIPASSSGLPVSLSVLSGPATVSGNTVTLTGGGTVVLAADQAGNGNYSAATQVTTSFTVKAATQTISPFPTLAAQTYAPNLVLPITAPTSSSGLPVTLSVISGPGSVIDSNNNLTVTGAGSVVLAANVSSNASYTAAAQVKGTLVINPAPQVLQPFTTIPNVVGEFSPNPIVITPPASSSTNPVVVTIKSGPARIANNIVTMTNNGTVVLSATQPASSNYLAATPVTTSFSVGRLAQSLVGTFSVTGKTYGVTLIGVPLPVSVDINNIPTTLPVSLSVISGPASVKGTNVTVTGAGLVTLAANQSGNATYGPAAQMTTTFNVAQASNAIAAFATIPPKTFGTAPFTLTVPTASSKLPVTLSVLSGPATITNNTVTINGVGSVKLAANQSGNANYSAAPEVTTSFAVSQAAQTITFAKPTAQSYGSPSFSLAATASSGLPVTYSTSSTNITISGNVVTILAAGTASITANQGGNANYSSANSLTQNLTVNPATQTITLSVPSSVTYVARGTVTLAATASSGLTVTFDRKSGPATLTGSTLYPTGKGTISVTAIQSGNNNYQSVSKQFTIIAK